ncbi:outer membrane protein assembly factor BamE [Saccharospirillum alexandrii]|uniref:outer membrane protein assembly factor BamE n=1 Tax=Saccharospirillum alexandrii TaxID=2448477 RepID=UPI0037359185
MRNIQQLAPMPLTVFLYCYLYCVLTIEWDDNDLNLKRTKVIARALISSALVSLTLSACTLLTPYQPELKQGNFVKEEQLQQLTPGMSTEQVQFLLGTPMLTGEDPQNRWVYPILDEEGEYRTVTVEFEGSSVARISRS